MDPKILEKPEARFIGIEAPFIQGLSPETNNHEVIPALWSRFGEVASRISDPIGKGCFGVIYGEPESERSHPDEIHYLAGLQVTSIDSVPEGLVGRAVKGDTYAVIEHVGPILGITDVLEEFYERWLPSSSYEHTLGADIEAYPENYDPHGDDSVMEYWAPVRRRT